jgi:hypothetical protein
MVKVLSNEGKIRVEGLYTFYGGEFASLKISVNNFQAEVIIDEDGEKELLFKTNVSSLQSIFTKIISNRKGKIRGKSEFFGQTEESILTAEEISEDEAVISISHTCKNSVIISKKAAKETLERINEIILKNMN